MRSPRFLKILAFLAVLYGFAGFFLLPFWIEKSMPDLVHNKTGAIVELQHVGFNPLTFTLTLEGLKFQTPRKEPFVSFDTMSIDIDPHALFYGAFRINSVALLKPEVFLKSDHNGTMNFAWLMASDTPKEELSQSEPSTVPRLILSALHIQEGRIHYADAAKEYEIALKPLDFKIMGIDTEALDDKSNVIRLASRINDGGFILLRSELLSLQPFRIQGSIAFDSGRLFTGWRYMQEQLALEIADGALHAKSHFYFDAQNPDETRLEKIALRLERLRIKPKDAFHDVLNVKQAALNEGALYPMKQQGSLGHFSIDGIELYLKRHNDGSINWQHYVKTPQKVQAPEPSEAPQSASNEKPWNVMLERFTLQNVHARFDDEAISPAQQLELNDFNLSASNISSLGGVAMELESAMRFSDTARCMLRGRVAHSALDVDTTVTCSNIDITRYNPYIDEAASQALQHFDLNLESALLDMTLPFRLEQNATDTAVRLHAGDVKLKAFRVSSKSTQKALVGFEALHVTQLNADTAKRDATVGQAVLDAPFINILKQPDGSLDWSSYVVAEKTQAAKASAESADLPWHYRVEVFDLDGGSINLKDHSLQQHAALHLDAITLHVKGVDSKAGSLLRYESAMRINDQAHFQSAGDVRQKPLRVRSQLQLNNLQLAMANPYLNESLNLYLGRGALDFKSNLTYMPQQQGPDLQLKGDVRIKDFVANAVRNDTLLLAFDEVRAAPLHMTLAPDSVNIEELKIHAPYANIHIDANKTLNVATLSKKTEQPEAHSDRVPEQHAKTPMAFNIIKTSITSGTSDFADDSLPLRFKTHIHDVEGTFYGISSQPDQTTYVNLDGVIDRYGAMKATGSLNSADPQKFTDIAVNFRNLSLANMSPYSANFAGRTIDEGKLSLDLNYKIADSQILGANKVNINKIKLGERFEGESSLPLGLAIALLEDSEGLIDIDMPVEGDMQNPDFKYGTVVWNAISNLIIKVVSSPFSVIGSVLGIDADALQHIAFESGSLELLPPEREKLDTLIEALHKRPKLSLKIVGSYERESDTKALQLQKLEAFVLERTGKQEGSVMLDNDFLESLYEEYYDAKALEVLETSLEKAYPDSEQFALHYNKALVKALMQRQILEPGELDFLARNRAVSIKNYLAQQIEAARIVLGENTTAEADENGYVPTFLEIIVQE